MNKFRKVFRLVSFLALPCLLLGCGYRAPMYKTVVTVDPGTFTSVREDYRDLAALLTSDTEMPPTDSNTLSMLPDAKEKFALLLDDMRGAEESVYIEHFRVRLDSIGTVFTDILKDKAHAGKDVRLIVDKGASVREDKKGHMALREDGVKSYLYHRPRWLQDFIWPSKGAHREHRKIVLVDGQTAYMGGRNIQDKYFQWRDCDIRIAGPAVKDLGEVFLSTQMQVAPDLPPLKITDESARKAVNDSIPGLVQYRQKTVQIIPESPFDKHLPIRNCFEWAISHSKHYFYFYTPYTPPPESILKALKDAAGRGVDVEWIVPGTNDVGPAKWMGESLYRELLLAGVKILEWQGSILHTKQFISDNYLTAIGSANMDNMSFFLNLEVEAVIYDEEIALDACRLFREDAAVRCVPVTLEDVRRWSIFRKLRNWIARALVGSIS
ncbi:MAG: hypothetical protein J5640_02050 [Bacteroidales bacterium]|nr:hypothetical protein [Bacteroidales bacterium]